MAEKVAPPPPYEPYDEKKYIDEAIQRKRAEKESKVNIDDLINKYFETPLLNKLWIIKLISLDIIKSNNKKLEIEILRKLIIKDFQDLDEVILQQYWILDHFTNLSANVNVVVYGLIITTGTERQKYAEHVYNGYIPILKEAKQIKK